MQPGQLHHVEYYVHDLASTTLFWDWLLTELGYSETLRWHEGISWTHPTGTYLVFVQIPETLRALTNNRQGPGLNHICFQGVSREHLAELAAELPKRGASLLQNNPDRLCFEEGNSFAVEIFL